MAGVYISGIEMPNGGTIKVEIGYDADGHPMAMTEDYSVYDVIPVPDHGRLGDLDELEKKAPELSEYLSVLAPTVIPANREEKSDGEPRIQVSRFEGQGGRSMTGPCPFPCTNKTELGYCKTTACILSPTIKVMSVPQTDAGEESMCILIRGIEMPKENAICVVIFPDGRVTSQFGVPHLGTAMPVPPHGKLIDADKLGIREAEKQAYEAYLQAKGEDFIEEPLVEYQRGYLDGLTHASGLVRFAPTVIPADEQH